MVKRSVIWTDLDDLLMSVLVDSLLFFLFLVPCLLLIYAYGEFFIT